MEVRLFSGLIILTMISLGTAYADDSLISVVTSADTYNEGETILISGNISTIIGQTQVTLQLFYNENLIDVAQIEISKDGNYSHTIIAQGPLWSNPGEYLVKVVYGEANIAETSFNFVPKSAILEVIDNFEVDAGDSGTFDIGYAIRGGTIEKISISPEILGLVIDFKSVSKGTLVLDLPRQYIDAEKQNGKDEEYIILVDNSETTYVETINYSGFRTILINFEEGDSEIQIIGTYVIPEFGTIVMIVLTIGIMTSILLTKNKFKFNF